MSENPNLIATADESTPYERATDATDDYHLAVKSSGSMSHADKPLKSPRVEKDVRSHDESATIRSLKSESTKAGAPGMDRLFKDESTPTVSRKAQGYGTKSSEMRKDIGA